MKLLPADYSSFEWLRDYSLVFTHKEVTGYTDFVQLLRNFQGAILATVTFFKGVNSSIP